jgi:hypothetical protein
MKYENFEQIESLVKEIRKMEALIEDIGSYPVVRITNGNANVVSISGYPSNEHGHPRFPEIATAFISSIKTDLHERITIAKSKLETL